MPDHAISGLIPIAIFWAILIALKISGKGATDDETDDAVPYGAYSCPDTPTFYIDSGIISGD